MLQQGKAVIDEFRDEAESVVGQINEAKESALGLWATISGLWDWATNLLGTATESDGGSKPVAAAESAKPPAKKSNRRTPEPELSYEEYKAKAIHDVCENLKVFFEAQRQLKAHCRELEEQSLTTDRVADSAIDRIEIETQLVSLSTQIREAMSWTPEHLGLQDMYQRFLKMYELILEEQEFDRQRKLRAARNKRWQQESRQNLRIDVAILVAGTALIVTVWWWTMFQVANLSGFSWE